MRQLQIQCGMITEVYCNIKYDHAEVTEQWGKGEEEGDATDERVSFSFFVLFLFHKTCAPLCDLKIVL